MRIDYFVDVCVVDVGIPDALRIDRDHRSFFASLHTAGLINPDLAGVIQIEILDALFGMLLRRLRAFVCTAFPGAGFALVQAKEDMMLIERLIAHGMGCWLAGVF